MYNYPPPPPHFFFTKLLGRQLQPQPTLFWWPWFFCSVWYHIFTMQVILHIKRNPQNHCFFRNEVSAHKYGTWFCCKFQTYKYNFKEHIICDISTLNSYISAWYEWYTCTSGRMCTRCMYRVYASIFQHYINKLQVS